MFMPERLESHLLHNQVPYSLILHGPTPSAQVAASLMHVPGKAVAKSVALRAGKKVLLALLPASYRINLDKLSAKLGKPVQLLEQDLCGEEFPDCETGAIPPFGELYDVPVFLDEALAEDPEIVFSAGTLCESVRIANADFIRLANPKICSFAEKPSRVPISCKAQLQPELVSIG